MKKRLSHALILLIVGCSKPGIPAPEAAILLAPDNLASCTTSFVVNANQSRVTFGGSKLYIQIHMNWLYERLVQASNTKKRLLSLRSIKYWIEVQLTNGG